MRAGQVRRRNQSRRGVRDIPRSRHLQPTKRSRTSAPDRLAIYTNCQTRYSMVSENTIMHVRLTSAAFAFCLPLLSISRAEAADYARAPFGTLADGQTVEAIMLRNAHGVTVRIIALGASIQALSVPDRDGKAADVVLGYAGLADYLRKPQYFGATV